jgi:hypothetical protein
MTGLAELALEKAQKVLDIRKLKINVDRRRMKWPIKLANNQLNK